MTGSPGVRPCTPPGSRNRVPAPSPGLASETQGVARSRRPHTEGTLERSQPPERRRQRGPVLPGGDVAGGRQCHSGGLGAGLRGQQSRCTQAPRPGDANEPLSSCSQAEMESGELGQTAEIGAVTATPADPTAVATFNRIPPTPRAVRRSARVGGTRSGREEDAHRVSASTPGPEPPPHPTDYAGLRPLPLRCRNVTFSVPTLHGIEIAFGSAGVASSSVP